MNIDNRQEYGHTVRMLKDLIKVVGCIVGCELVGILGALFTMEAISGWYITLNKPVFAPPNWVFGPAWTLLYFLMGVSFYLIVKKGWKKKAVKTAAMFFLVQLGLNFLWSPVFFGLRSPLLGLITILAMWIMIVLTMRKFYPISKGAFYLLVPYLLWVSFATVLNAAILIGN